jgi:tetratricopeptide (TPR) repeat protein
MSLRAALLALAATLSGVVHAQPTKEAGEHFERGERAQAEGRYRDAIASYEAAFALVPHPNAVFNIAVCYEKLGEWHSAAESYEKYLDLDKSASDAAVVRGKIRALRAKAGDPGPPVGPMPQPYHAGPPPGLVDRPPPPDEPAQKFHAGVSYGLGFGDSVAERYLAHAGIRIARRIDLDGVLGLFGKNDLAIGALGKLTVARSGYVVYLVRGAATIGYAKQDNSSSAGTRAPLGFEAGGAIAFGKGGRFELGAGLRWTVGGWTSDATTADSYVNDAMAFVIDLGVALDFPVSVGPKRPGYLAGGR